MVNLRVILADDHPFVLLGVRSALSAHRDILIAGEATGPTSLIDLLRSVPCDVLVTDLTMPEVRGAMGDGLHLIRRIRDEWPALRVVVLTGLTNTAILRSVVSDGAVGILNKTEAMTELIAAIRCAADGRVFISGSILEALAELKSESDGTWRISHLSSRESEVIGLFSQGKSISEIARALGRDARTVSRQKRIAMAKLGVANDPGLFAYVRAHGVV
ncbi:response regulator transcription factor [Paraburkholderia phenazinium]|jgi:two-component system capsular synthesis response regulator RcsB|uniref:Two component transcriptional regulator, LuxR family n=1 Tax=Paraburkholderia phenazinium TaxID=60549 RepID=A0A1G7WZQ7_9BURK|nr:response regulator transcription factor [Paraburkholderia phenazinium]SDG77395.1 two component transcriptional regulator, LuxR family [Paraburkholderia phenazinium]